MSNLTVICPNARRCIVKVTPRTLLREVVEEACLKHGFDINDHVVFNQNKIVDLALPFRLSGLPNNATLEVQASLTTKSAEADIALQLPDGRRKLLKFKISETLATVVHTFSNEFGEDLHVISNNEVPSCVYMNKTYSGGELDTKTLGSIGISGGRCLIRYQRLILTDKQIQQLEVKIKEEEERKKALSEQYEQKKQENEERDRIEAERLKKFEIECKILEQERAAKAAAEEMEVDSDSSDDVPIAPVVTQDRLPSPPPVNSSSAWSFDRPFSGNQAPSLNINSAGAERIANLNRLLQEVDGSIRDGGRANVVDILAEGGRLSVSEIATAATEMERAPVSEENITVFHEPCDRRIVMFDKRKPGRKGRESMDADADADVDVDIDDSFFDVGISDVKKRQKELREQVMQETNRALLPKSYIEKKNRAAKLEAYTHSVVRFTAGNYVIQANFNTNEPVSRLFETVSSILKTPVKFALNFALNDPLENTDKKNLVDLNVAPKTTLYVKFLSTVDTETIFAPIMVRKVSSIECDSISSEWLSVNSVYQPFNGLLVKDERSVVKRVGDHQSPNQPPAKTNAPKWMKFK